MRVWKLLHSHLHLSLQSLKSFSPPLSGHCAVGFGRRVLHGVQACVLVLSVAGLRCCANAFEILYEMTDRETHTKTDRRTDRQTYRQTNTHSDTQLHGHTDRQAGSKTDIHIHTEHINMYIYAYMSNTCMYIHIAETQMHVYIYMCVCVRRRITFIL